MPLIPEFRSRTTEDDDGPRKGGRLYLPTVRQQWQRPDDARKRVHARCAENTAARLLSSRGRNDLTSGDPRRIMVGVLARPLAGVDERAQSSSGAPARK